MIKDGYMSEGDDGLTTDESRLVSREHPEAFPHLYHSPTDPAGDCDSRALPFEDVRDWNPQRGANVARGRLEYILEIQRSTSAQ